MQRLGELAKILKRSTRLATMTAPVWIADFPTTEEKERRRANSRNATLAECAQVGTEHGVADAKYAIALFESGASIAAITEQQVQRAHRRVSNLLAAGLSEAQIEAYTDAADAALQKRLAIIEARA